jgi:hypothetical protein
VRDGLEVRRAKIDYSFGELEKMETNWDSYTVKTGIIFPRWLLAYPGLSHAAKITYAIIRAASRGKAGAGISLSELAASVGDSEEKVAEYLRELEGCRLIGKEADGAGGFGGPKDSFQLKAKERKHSGERPPHRRPLSRYSFQTCFEFAQKLKESGEDIRDVRAFSGHLYWTGAQDEEIALMLLSNGAPDPRAEKATNVVCYQRN